MGIGKRTFQSAGRVSQHLIPGAYSRIDSVKGAGGIVSVNNGVVMGNCHGGKPQILLQFNSIADAAATLRSGPLMDAVRLAFNPGNDFVPQRLFAMRVNTALQASSYLKDATSNNMVKLLSRDYGLHTNQIKYKLESGTVEGKKITVAFQIDQEEFDDVIRKSFDIQYIGTEETCTMDITNNDTTQTLVTTAGTDSLDIDLNSYPTIEELAGYINDHESYTCTAKAGQEQKSSLELDGVSSQDIKTAEYTVESTMQAIIDKINNESNLIKAEAVNGTNNRAIPENVATFTYLTGGSEGSYTTTEWTSALQVLEAEDIQYISTPDTDASVHSALKTHCEQMSSVTGKKERQFVLGGDGTEDVSTMLTNSAALNSKYGMYAGAKGKFNQYDVDGKLKEYATSYIACMLMGMKCAAAINEPLTFKTLNLLSINEKFTESELEQLIEGGVAPVNYNSNGIPHLVRQVNSYQTDDLKWNEFSMVGEMLFASRDLRTYLESLFVGKAGNIKLGVIKGAVVNRLELYTDLGVFVAGDDGKAYWNVQLSISGDTVWIDYDANITAPINFMFVTNHFHEVVVAA